ncbi:TPA: DUF551 domain-containing protein [Klebsiella pneumoniae]
MTSKLTRAQLHERARENVKALKLASRQTAFESAREEILADLQLAELALAAMDSEPVAIIDQANLDYLRSGADADVWPPEREEMGDVLLYRHAQPAPVVPEEAYSDDCQELYPSQPDAWPAGWNACRAAMLAAATRSPGSEPATVPGKWIPVSERMPEEGGRYWCYVEEQNSLGKSHYQWNCSWNGDRWWVESEGGGIVTHWMPLPSAPQEVKP